MKANTLKLDYLVLHNQKIILVTTEVLNAIKKEEHLDEEDKTYKPIALTDKWLAIFGFNKKVNPINKNTYYSHNDTDLRIIKYKNHEVFYLGYTFKEKNDNIELKYEPKINYLQDLFDAFYLIKKLSYELTSENLVSIEIQLNKDA